MCAAPLYTLPRSATLGLPPGGDGQRSNPVREWEEGASATGCSASGRAEVWGGVTSSSLCGLPSNGSGHGIPVDAAPGSGPVWRPPHRRLPSSSGYRQGKVKEQGGHHTQAAEPQSHPPRPGRSGGRTRDRIRQAEQSTTCPTDDRTRPTVARTHLIRPHARHKSAADPAITRPHTGHSCDAGPAVILAGGDDLAGQSPTPDPQSRCVGGSLV